MRTNKDWSDAEKKAVALVKKTFARELSIRRQKPYEFLKSKRMTDELNNLIRMLDGDKGFSILSLARIIDAFGYDIDFIKRTEEFED